MSSDIADFTQHAHEYILQNFDLGSDPVVQASAIRALFNHFAGEQPGIVDGYKLIEQTIKHFDLRHDLYFAHECAMVDGKDQQRSDALAMAVILNTKVRKMHPGEFPDNDGRITQATIDIAKKILTEANSLRHIEHMKLWFKLSADNSNMVSKEARFMAQILLTEKIYHITEKPRPTYDELVDFLQYDLCPAERVVDEDTLLGRQLRKAVNKVEPAVIGELMTYPLRFY